MQLEGQPKILIADDDEFVAEHVRLVLEGAGAETIVVPDGEQAIGALSPALDVVIADIEMPGASGLEVLAIAHKRYPNLPVIILSGAGQIEDAVVALKRGAYDYITKPFNEVELLSRVSEASKRVRLETENRALREQSGGVETRVDLVAESASSKQLKELALRCAAVDSTVLITGPSGTGKSMLARWIHQSGTRGGGPFVTVNCGAIPRELIESELFGHVKGAFTGATDSRAGRFEAANGGTLFLDEIGELPLDLQPKLLSAIQDRRVSRVGSAEEIDVDVRIISATNRDLPLAVEERSFREDLYYRINVLSLEIEALARRRDDILPLARRMLEIISKRMQTGCPALSEEAQGRLLNHSWPGNVRELSNILERAIVFSDADVIQAADLGQLVGASAPSGVQDLSGLTLAELEKRAILGALQAASGNRAQAARALGVSERTIYNRLKAYGDEGAESPPMAVD